MKFTRKPKRKGGTRKKDDKGSMSKRILKIIYDIFILFFGVFLSKETTEYISTLLSLSEKKEIESSQSMYQAADILLTSVAPNVIISVINRNSSEQENQELNFNKTILDKLKEIKASLETINRDEDFCFWDGNKWIKIGKIYNIEVSIVTFHDDAYSIEITSNNGTYEQSYYKNSSLTPVLKLCNEIPYTVKVHIMKNNNLFNVFKNILEDEIIL